MIGSAVDFGAHAPFVLAAYAASFIVIAALIISRRSKLKNALEAERAENEQRKSDAAQS